jgi:hypothetical protein
MWQSNNRSYNAQRNWEVSYRRWPNPIPNFLAFSRTEVSLRLSSLEISSAGVLAFECALSFSTSSFDHGLRGIVFFAIFAPLNGMSHNELQT